mmetsp:Transcript_35773/g.90227  ORF Transcript_35773/g.90227 Transcript_35773/m.90227 type:complete len:176 (+) Transcript_35773:170-697(+)
MSSSPTEMTGGVRAPGVDVTIALPSGDNPEYLKGFAYLQKKTRRWMTAAAKGQPLPLLARQEVTYWQEWLDCADANRCEPRPDRDMRKFMQWQVQVATSEAPLQQLPVYRDDVQAPQPVRKPVRGRQRCITCVLLMLVILLAGGCAVSAVFGVSLNAQVNKLSAQLAALKDPPGG